MKSAVQVADLKGGRNCGYDIVELWKSHGGVDSHGPAATMDRDDTR